MSALSCEVRLRFKMKTERVLIEIVGVKVILCIVSLVMVAMALVTYSATVTITTTQQFSIGATSASWTVYVNDVDKVRYLPGGSAEPTLNTGDPSTYAFKVTDAQSARRFMLKSLGWELNLRPVETSPATSALCFERVKTKEHALLE